MTIKFGPGTIIAGFQHPGDGPRSTPTTPGIAFSMFGTGATIRAALNVYKNTNGLEGQWTTRNSSTYAVPTGYTFISAPSIDYWGDNATRADTWNVRATGANNSFATVLLGPQINVNDKVMFSLELSTYPDANVWSAVGVATEPDLNKYLGQDAGSVAVYDNGETYYNDTTIVNGSTPYFQSSGTIVDLLINNVTQKFWYSVNGSAWIGDYTDITMYEPTGTPTQDFGGDADFEMALYDVVDPGTVPDISGNGNTMSLNDATYSGASTNYYHFLNNSAQANNSAWPADASANLAIMGWFRFGNLSGNKSLVSRNEGSNGWALRIDNSGGIINLVKYNVADQNYSIPNLTAYQWHFIAAAQHNDTINFCIDGTIYSGTYNSTPFASSGGPVRLQYDPYNGGDQGTEMWMRDVKIVSSVSVSDTQLLAVWNAQKANYGY